MVSNIALTIGIPLLFLILFQMVSLARETPVDTDLKGKEHRPIGETDTVDYDEFTENSYAYRMADFLPTLGRWSMGIGVFGIFHLIITTYLFVVVTGLAYIGLNDNNYALIGAIGLAAVWLLLPFFEVEDYHRLTEKHLRPKSIDFHVTAVFFELLMVAAIVTAGTAIAGGIDVASAFLDLPIPGWIITIIGGIAVFLLSERIFAYHNLFYNPYFVILLSQEMAAIRESEGIRKRPTELSDSN